MPAHDHDVFLEKFAYSRNPSGIYKGVLNEHERRQIFGFNPLEGPTTDFEVNAIDRTITIFHIAILVGGVLTTIPKKFHWRDIGPERPSTVLTMEDLD